MIRFIRSAFVIARRDFGATVLSKTFVFFLLAPLFPLLMGGVFASIGARVATQSARPVVAVISSEKDFERLSIAREGLALMAQGRSNAAIAELSAFSQWLRESDVRGVVIRSGKPSAFRSTMSVAAFASQATNRPINIMATILLSFMTVSFFEMKQSSSICTAFMASSGWI